MKSCRLCNRERGTLSRVSHAWVLRFLKVRKTVFFLFILVLERKYQYLINLYIYGFMLRKCYWPSVIMCCRRINRGRRYTMWKIMPDRCGNSVNEDNRRPMETKMILQDKNRRKWPWKNSLRPPNFWINSKPTWNSHISGTYLLIFINFFLDFNGEK